MARAERRLDEMVSVVLSTADAMDASQRLTAEPVSVAGLVETVAASLDRTGGARRVVTEVESGAEVVVTVPAYLQLALRCVVDNGLRFSPMDRPVTVTVARGDDAVVIGVHDEGPGIDDGFRDEAFQPFTQAGSSSQRAHGGLGIGLFTARRIVERLGGAIRIEDPADCDTGTTVVIVLPQQREGDLTGRSRRQASGPSRVSGHARARTATTGSVLSHIVG